MSTKNIILLAFVLIITGLVGTFLTAGPSFSAFDNGIEYEKKWDFEGQDINNIQIKSSYKVDIQFIESEDQTSYIHIDGLALKDVVQKVEGTEIKNNGLSLDLTHKGWKPSFFIDLTALHQQTVTVALAKGAKLHSLQTDTMSNRTTIDNASAEQATIKASSGSIRINDLHAADIQIQSSSGSIRGDNISGQTVNAKSSSGSITLNQVEGNSVTVESSSGSIKGSSFKGDTRAKSSSGSINIDHLEGLLSVESTSGSIRLTQQAVTETKVISSSGTVRMEVRNFTGFYETRSSSGSIRVPDSKRQSDQYINVRTSSGSIRIIEN